MRSVTAGQRALLHNWSRQEAFRVIVRRRDGSQVDLSSRVLSVSGNWSDDELVSTCNISFDDGWTQFGAAEALSPLVASSAFNNPSPILWPNNEVFIWVGFAALGAGVADWNLIFHGVLGDQIQPKGRKESRTLDVSCRDQAKRLQETYLIGEYLFGTEKGTAAVAVVQGILDTKLGAAAPTLHVRDNPAFVIYPVRIGDKTLWDACADILKPAGYQLRYWFWAGGSVAKDCKGNALPVTADGFYLTCLDPGRGRTVTGDTIDEAVDTISEEDLEIRDDTVRNSITIRYYDRDTKEYMEIHRDSMASIAIYGTRDLVIGQDDVPYIDTFPEGWNLGGVLLHDLSEPPATDKFGLQMMWHLEPFDFLDVTAARLATGTARMGVRQISFDMVPGEPFGMTLTGVRDRVLGQVRAWLVAGSGAPPSYFPVDPPIGHGVSYARMLEDGTLRTETILEVIPPPGSSVENYEWKWALEGQQDWHAVITTDPVLRLHDLPPGKAVAWTCRAKLTGERR